MRRGRIWIFVLLIVIIGLVVGFVAIRQFLVPATPAEQPAVNVKYLSRVKTSHRAARSLRNY